MYVHTFIANAYAVNTSTSKVLYVASDTSHAYIHANNPVTAHIHKSRCTFLHKNAYVSTTHTHTHTHKNK